MQNASSDVDMAAVDPVDVHDESDDDSEDSGTDTPPRSPSPAHHSPIPVDDDDRPPSADPPPSSSAAEGAASSSEATAAPDAARGRKSQPSSSSVAAGAKPKSTKSAAPRASSPSPPPAPARPPLQTIRLEISLGGPDDYEINISELAKQTGQRPATPVLAAKRDTSDESEGDDEAEPPKQQPEAADQQGKRRRKVRLSSSAFVRPAGPGEAMRGRLRSTAYSQHRAGCVGRRRARTSPDCYSATCSWRMILWSTTLEQHPSRNARQSVSGVRYLPLQMALSL